MSRFPESCVVDASVGIKLFLDEDGSEAVRDLFECLVGSGDCLFVPDLFYIECANILWKRVMRGEYPADLAAGHISDMKDLALPSTPTIDLIEPALDIACERKITAYDACYVALSQIKQVPLLTADERLASTLVDSPHEVITLCQVI